MSRDSSNTIRFFFFYILNFFFRKAIKLISKKEKKRNEIITKNVSLIKSVCCQQSQRMVLMLVGWGGSMAGYGMMEEELTWLWFSHMGTRSSNARLIKKAYHWPKSKQSGTQRSAQISNHRISRLSTECQRDGTGEWSGAEQLEQNERTNLLWKWDAAKNKLYTFYTKL